MTLGAYDTYQLVSKIEEMKSPMPFYLNNFFGRIMEFETEEIHFDYVSEERNLAPFVSPLVEGQAMKVLGSSMKSFRPAYVKPKHVVRPTEVLKRLPGEAFGGGISPQQKMQLATLENFRRESEAIDNRLEWMVVELLKNGSITVVGDSYPESLVDFGRDAGLSITLAGATRWNDSAPDPIGDIESTATLMSQAPFGAPGTDIFMDPAAWTLFRSHIQKTENQALLLDTTLAGQYVNVDRGPMVHDDNVQYVGTLSGRFRIYVDSRFYHDSDGNVVPYLAANEVLMVSSAIQGVQCFGAILDESVMRAMRAYPKSWTQEDPSVRFTMTQSAPLPVAERINCSAYLKVA